MKLGLILLSSKLVSPFRVPTTMKHVCVAARIGDGKAPGEANTHCIRKTSNAASADSGSNPSGWPVAPGSRRKDFVLGAETGAEWRRYNRGLRHRSRKRACG